MARPAAETHTKKYEEDLKYFLGENHWPSVRSWLTGTNDAWKNRSVRNYLYAVVDHKGAVCLDAAPSTHVDPFGQPVPLEMRQQIGAAVDDELTRLGVEEAAEDVFMRGGPCGVGGTILRLETDPLSGEQRLVIDELDMRRFYPDPAYPRMRHWRYAAYCPDLPTSVIRDTFKERGYLVKASGQTVGQYEAPSDTRTRTEDEMIYGPGGDLAISAKDGSILNRTAQVCFVWIRDDSLAQELLQKIVAGPEMLAQCPECGAMAHADVGTGGEQDCPCGYMGPMPQVEKPAEVEDYTIVTRAYPYGRLIAYSGDVLLFDGPQDLPLDPHGPGGMFPTSFYTHNRVAGRFWGYGDVALGKSIQMAIDKNAAQAMDALRMTFNGPFEYPAEAEGFTNLNNSPGQAIPVSLPFVGKARYITPQSTNLGLFQVVEETLQRDIQRVLGVSDVSVGLSPTAPTSGVEVQARQRAASTRIGRHLKALNAWRSDVANKVWQIMQAKYAGPRTIMMPSATGSDYEAIVLELASLPRDVRIRVDANIDAIQKEENMGQNLVMMLSNPAIVQSPFFDLIVSIITKDPVMSEEVKLRRDMFMQQQAMLAAIAPPPAPGEENGGPPKQNGKPDSKTPNQDEAFSRMGGR